MGRPFQSFSANATRCHWPLQKPMSLQFLQSIQKLLGWDPILVRQDFSTSKGGSTRKGASYHCPWGFIDCGCYLSLPLPKAMRIYTCPGHGLWCHLMIMRWVFKEGIQICFTKVNFIETSLCRDALPWKLLSLGKHFQSSLSDISASGLTLLQALPCTTARGIFLKHPFDGVTA